MASMTKGDKKAEDFKIKKLVRGEFDEAEKDSTLKDLMRVKGSSRAVKESESRVQTLNTT